jgi:ABC-2 type transport system permease protein
MSGIFTVLGFTFKEYVRKKSFIISTIIMLLLTVILFCLPSIISSIQSATSGGAGASGNQSSLGTVYVIDSDKILSSDFSALHTAFPGYSFEAESADKLKSLENTTKNSDKMSIVVLYLQNNTPAFAYYVKKSGNGPDTDMLSKTLKSAYTTKLLSENNVPDSVTSKVLSDVPYSVTELGKGMLAGMISSYAIIFVLFFAIYMYGYWVAMSIASEKTSRVMELLITSTKPSRIVIGKSAAMGLIGLMQLALIILTGIATYMIAFPKDLKLLGETFSLSNFSPLAIIMIFVYFLLGFSLYAMLNAVAGATISKAEDIQSAIMPISMIAMISFYLSYAGVLSPDSTMAKVVSIIPFTAPFSMPTRLLNTNVPGYEVVASVLLLILTTALMGFISIKLYSSAVLHYGKKLKFSELIKISRANH